MTMLHIDLCCGLGGWQAPFKADDSWRSVGIDIRPDLNPDVVADVRQLPLSECEPTLVTASPPCTEFSTARREPMALRNPDFSIWNGCVRAILDLEPEWFVIENVRGLVHWMGPAHKIVGRDWFLWGDFPPFDVEVLGGKPLHAGKQSARPSQIPYPLANALKVAIEKWG